MVYCKIVEMTPENLFSNGSSSIETKKVVMLLSVAQRTWGSESLK